MDSIYSAPNGVVLRVANSETGLDTDATTVVAVSAANVSITIWQRA